MNATETERTCRFCGNEVTSTNPEVDFCENCWRTGRSQEELRAEQIATFLKLTGADTVEVQNTGGNCFWLTVRFADEEDFYVLTDGEASLPDQPHGGWRYVGLHNESEASPHYEGTQVRFLDQDIAADEGLSDGEAALVITRHRQGKRPYPRRGETRVQASNGSWEEATVFRFGVPTALAKEIGPDAMFRVEVTPEGVLYRWIEGKAVGRPADSRPDWLGS